MLQWGRWKDQVGLVWGRNQPPLILYPSDYVLLWVHYHEASLYSNEDIISTKCEGGKAKLYFAEAVMDNERFGCREVMVWAGEESVQML